MRKFMILAIACTVLTGCASMQEAAKGECVDLGMQPGTPVFVNCYEQSMMRRQSAINAAIAN